MITHVRFQTTVVIGGVETNEWSADRPGHSRLANGVTVRPGNAALGEGRESLVFECRIGKDAYDVEVPRSNIAHVIRTPAEAPADGKAKK